MYCVECGSKLPEGAAFCGECGTPVPLSGASLQANANIPAGVSAASSCEVQDSSGLAAGAPLTSETKGSNKKKRLIILGTGGTIAGVGIAGKSTGYKPGELSVKDLLLSVPSLETLADIEALQVCNVNSDDMTAPLWIKLAKTINEQAKRPEIAGFVITHGTDTMEETAYFLNLVVKTDKPVVVTGSMRPSTAMLVDGPANIYQAVLCAASDESVGRGVQLVLSGQVISAYAAQKTHTHALESMSGGMYGCRGVICDDLLVYTSTDSRPHTVNTEFCIDAVNDLPSVNVVFFNVDADPALLRYAAGISEGLVVAGAGAGEFSLEFAKAIDEVKVPVVLSSRVGAGMVPFDSCLCEKGIPARGLTPQKAAVLLRLALTVTDDSREIRRIFETY